LIPLAAVALALVLQTPARAQDQTPRTFGLKAGYWIPGEGVLRDVLGSGLSVGASYSLPVRPDRWIDFEVSYWSRSGDLPVLVDEVIPGGRTYRSSNVALLPVTLSLRAEALPVKGVRPFVFGGAGLTVVKEEVHISQTPPGPDSEGTNKLSNAFLGLQFGGGAERDVGERTAAYLEVRFSIVNADTPDVNGLIGNGVSLGGLGIYAGLRIK